MDYCTYIFISCHKLCHGEIHGIDYRDKRKTIRSKDREISEQRAPEKKLEKITITPYTVMVKNDPIVTDISTPLSLSISSPCPELSAAK